jgi:hypothetical protein
MKPPFALALLLWLAAPPATGVLIPEYAPRGVESPGADLYDDASAERRVVHSVLQVHASASPVPGLAIARPGMPAFGDPQALTGSGGPRPARSQVSRRGGGDPIPEDPAPTFQWRGIDAAGSGGPAAPPGGGPVDGWILGLLLIGFGGLSSFVGPLRRRPRRWRR